jgi:hypothetical protein
LREKAQELARQMGIQDFEASSGWLFWFRDRHGISWEGVSADDESADINAAKVWKEEMLEIVQSYKSRTFSTPKRQPPSTNCCVT